MDHVFEYTLWDGSTPTTAVPLTSNAIDLRFTTRAEYIAIKVTSVLSTADVKLRWAGSPDGTNRGPFDENSDIITESGVDFTNPEDWNQVSLPNFLSPYVFFELSQMWGMGDVKAYVRLGLRETIGAR